jgi:hypothetical protein
MFGRKTLFVLGAGASKPYGFPVARELKTEICDDILYENEKFKERVNNFVGGGEIRRREWWDRAKSFAEDFSKSPVSSVDSFLEGRREFEDIGKMCISIQLIPYESIDDLHDHRKDKWYDWIFREMYRGPEKRMSKDEVKIITFNYDRSFEKFFVDGIKSTFGVSREKSYKIFRKSISDFIHVYGKLGELEGRSEVVRKYEPKVDGSAVEKAFNQIELIYEVERSEKRRKLRQMVEWAGQICFLGFGYHEENLKLLGLDEVDLGQTSIFGTGYQLTERKRKWIKERFSSEYQRRINLGRESLDCLSFLQQTPQLTA